jgi:hypothetical protein
MIGNRLAKLEKLVEESAANCPGCARTSCLVLLPGEAPPADETARCERCDRVQRRTVIRIVVPGLPGKIESND